MPIPPPEVHCEIVLRSGVRYVGHVMAETETLFHPTLGMIAASVRIDGGSSVIDVRLEEIAAIERFLKVYEMAMHCEICRAQLHASVP